MASQDIIYDWNVKTGKVVRDEEALKKMLGYQLKDIDSVRDLWKNLIHVDDYRRVYDHLKQSLDNKLDQYYKVEYKLRKADGSQAHVIDKGYIIRNNQGEAVRVVGALSDISASRVREQQLNLINGIKTELSAPGDIQKCLARAVKTLGKKANLAMAEAWLISVDKRALNLIELLLMRSGAAGVR